MPASRRVEDVAVPSTCVAGPIPEPAPWRTVFAGYASEAKLAPATVKRWTGVLTALEDAVGTDDLVRITREALIAWKSELLASGRDPRTVRDAYVAAVNAVMNWAVANARLPANPAAGVVVAVPDKPKTRDREFTDAEAATILRGGAGAARSTTFAPACRRPPMGALALRLRWCTRQRDDIAPRLRHPPR